MLPNNVVRLLIKGHQVEKLSAKDTREARARIAQDVEEFLAKGGKIEVVPGYETTENRDRLSQLSNWGMYDQRSA